MAAQEVAAPKAKEGAIEEATAPKPEAGEKPSLYWIYHTQREKKWKERRQMRKQKKDAAKEAESARKRARREAQGKGSEDSFSSSDEEDAGGPGEGADTASPAPAPTAAAATTGPAAPGGGKKRRKKKRRKLQEGAAEAQCDGAAEQAVADATNGVVPAMPRGKASEETEEHPAAVVEATPVAAVSAEELAIQKSIHPGGFFSEQRFDDLNISEAVKRALKESKFEMLTDIQAKSIPHLLNGKDVLAAAKTGSGKTLAFLVPSVDLLYNVKFLPRNGVGALVISPTRELAMQIYDVLRNVAKYVSQTIAICVGGMNRRQEADKLVKGVNTLVATPGRLLDHMQNTKGFVFHNMVHLTIDEADRILEVGFEEEINMIIKLLPAKRQTALFSATQTRKVADLARLSLTKPVFVESKSQDNVATVAGLTQGYVVCPAANRFMLLFTFLKRNRDKKVMVFLSTCNSVKFHDELLNYIDLPVQCIHGQKKQASRSSTFYSFCAAEKGILLCTDVAARGLDIPRVDWIVQYDPPDEPKEYIHRVGRTARGAKGTGKALLMLMPEELGFLQYLRRFGVPVAEYSFPVSKLANIQSQLERVIEKNYHLHRSSRDAYRAYMHAYAAHSHKDCFDVHKLDLSQVAKAFGFGAPPKVDLNLKHTARKGKAPGARGGGGPKGELHGKSSGHVFSAANPYGQREASDKRQFVR